MNTVLQASRLYFFPTEAGDTKQSYNSTAAFDLSSVFPHFPLNYLQGYLSANKCHIQSE